LFPEFEWKPHNFINSIIYKRNITKFVEFASENDISNEESWYSLHIIEKIYESSMHDIIRKYYEGSLGLALESLFPQVEKWQHWRFNDVHSTFWEDVRNQRDYFHWLGIQLGIMNEEHWYNFASSEKVNKLHGRILLKEYYEGYLG